MYPTTAAGNPGLEIFSLPLRQSCSSGFEGRAGRYGKLCLLSGQKQNPDQLAENITNIESLKCCINGWGL